MFKLMQNSKVLLLLLFGIALLYFCIGINFNINIYDEGVGLAGAMRVMAGEIPYRDFWTIYSPLNYYILSIFIFITNGNLLALRLISLIVPLLLFYTLHLLIRKSNDNKLKFTSGIVLIMTIGYSLFFAKPMGIALLFSALSILFFIRPFENRNKSANNLSSILCGIFAGLTLLSRLDTGILLLMSLLISTIILNVIKKRAEGNLQAHSSYSLLIIAGILVTVLPVAIYFILQVKFHTLIEQLISIPMNLYGPYRKITRLHIWDVVKATGFNNAMYILWFGVFSLMPGASAILIYLKYRFDKNSYNKLSKRIIITTPFIAFGFMLISQTIVRPDNEHFIPTLLFTVTALFSFFDKSYINKIYRSIFLIAMVLFCTYFLFAKRFIIINSNSPSYSAIAKIQDAEGIIIGNDWKKDLEPAVEYIRNNTNVKEKIFVANDRHDMGYRNDVMFYYLVQRYPATKYHELHPGVVSKAEVQNEIISELKKNSVKYIIRVQDLNMLKEPNLSSKSSGVRILDTYIDCNYKVVRRFGMYEILQIISPL